VATCITCCLCISDDEDIWLAELEISSLALAIVSECWLISAIA